MSLSLCLMSLLLIPFAAAGLALLQQGLGRSRSAAQTMLGSLCALATAAIVFVLVGSAWMGFAGGAAHVLHLGGRNLNWLGAEPLFAASIRGSLTAGLGRALVLAFGMFAVGLCSLIPINAGSDRWRLAAVGAATALLAAILFPLMAHWVWGGGWLAQLGPLFGPLSGLPGFTDMGGAGVIQVTGGLCALSVAWIVGPRQGKYTEGSAAAIPGHNIVQVLFGCMLALIGWIGLEAAAAMLFYSASLGQIALTVINAVLASSAGCLAAVLTTRLRYRKPDASLSANGWIAGLVAGSAGGGRLTPVEGILIALVAGMLVTFLVELLELRLLIDDPGGAISVHLGAGLWGLLAYGLFAPATAPRAELLLSQLIGIATLVGLMFPVIHISHRLLNRVIPFRVDADGDWQGMDIRELGAGAYPEFVLHADEFTPR
ncbi:MAG: ammonium transporter [Acidobacteriaceae bacterium]